MAGHSKWNNIKNRKGALDAKRAKLFGQISKLIRVAVKEGKSDDPKFNPTLRTVLDKARAANMPKEKIQKALERGMGKSASGSSIHEIAYEAFGPGGTALIILALTDNPTRTSAELKFILSRHHGALSSPGSAQYLFHRNPEGEFVPQMPLEISEEDMALLVELVDKLRENEDVEVIYSSTTLPEDDE